MTQLVAGNQQMKANLHMSQTLPNLTKYCKNIVFKCFSLKESQWKTYFPKSFLLAGPASSFSAIWNCFCICIYIEICISIIIVMCPVGRVNNWCYDWSWLAPRPLQRHLKSRGTDRLLDQFVPQSPTTDQNHHNHHTNHNICFGDNL